MRRRRTLAAAAVAGVLAAVTSGCLASGGSNASSSAGATTGANKNTGKSIEIMYGFTDTSSDQFKQEINKYAQSQGITVKFSPTPDFNTLINTRVRGNQAPDIALFPQPGIMKQLAKSGKLVPLDDVVTSADTGQMVQGALDAGKLDGKQYAIPASINVKSIVFYPKKPWTTAGYTAPTTVAELQQLTDKIKASGTTPWCFGIESGAATGWPATDWLEQLVLSQSGASVYNQWVDHTIAFNADPIAKAASTMSTLLLTKGNVNGGRSSIAGNNFATAANPMFAAKPGCYLYRQGNFVARSGGFPTAVLAKLDSTVGVFPFPGVTADQKPVEGGGDLAALFSGNNDSAKKLMQFMASKDFGADWAKANGFISPRKDFDQANYPNQLTKQMADIAYKSTTFVFDGSDQMPGAVGSGTFWKDMTTWVSGQESQEQALTNIQKSWPTTN